MSLTPKSSKSGASMMRRLKISHALAALVILPLLMALVLAGILVGERQKTAADISTIEQMGAPMFLLSELVHELQKERGATAVFMTNGDAEFGARMQAQRAVADQKQAAFDSVLAASDYAATDATWQAMLADVNAGLAERSAIRQRIDNKQITKAAAFDYYTAENSKALDLVKFTGRLSGDVAVANAIKGYAFYLMGKERAGIERAVGASGFATGQFSTLDRQKLQNLISTQDLYFKEFQDMAVGAQADILPEIMQSEAAQAVQTMRDTAMAGAAGTFSGAGFTMANSVASYSAADFFDAQTKKIDLLKDGENQIAAALQALIAGTEATAIGERNLLILVMSGVLLLIGGFSVLLSRSISNSVIGVVDTAERMADGDLDTAFPAIANNEIGRITAALMKFRDSILEGQRKDALAKAKEIELRQAQAQQEDEQRAAKKELEDQALARERALQEEREAHEFEARAAEKAAEAAQRKHQDALRKKEAQAATDIAKVVQAFGGGDFSKEMNIGDKDGVFAEICVGMNRIGSLTNSNLEQVQAALSALKNGHISYRMEGAFSGAFSIIQHDMNDAFASLASVIYQIDSSSAKVRASTNEIAEASTSLATRTEAAAANLEETASSVEALSKAVHRTSELATETNSSITGIESQTKKSTEIVRETVEAINGIKAASTSISKTITVIDEIAFQTNLLALNAGVEAARAGDAGRGFAVVASEIRALAAKSSDAAQEISNLVKNNETQVAEGVKLVDETGAALTRIDDDITAISQSVKEIADSATHQSGLIDEIKRAADQLDKVTQENAAMFEETTALNVSLKTETELLRNIMTNFELENQVPNLPEERVVTLRSRAAPRRVSSAAVMVEPEQDWQDF